MVDPYGHLKDRAEGSIGVSTPSAAVSSCGRGFLPTRMSFTIYMEHTGSGYRKAIHGLDEYATFDTLIQRLIDTRRQAFVV